MSALKAIYKRELGGYFGTPIAYVFIVIFIFLTGIFTFKIGNFFERNQANGAWEQKQRFQDFERPFEDFDANLTNTVVLKGDLFFHPA